MAYITPDTYVKLVRFDVTKEHQLTFSDETTQKNFFDNLQGLVLSNFTYQRKDNVIRYPALYEDIEKYNYCIYCNEAQSNKYYYCYITDMKYINDEMTEITIKTDVFQTWQFDIIYKQSFIEREHVVSDSIGYHTIPEGLETGEYIINNQYSADEMSSYAYVLQVTEYYDESVSKPTPDYTNFGGLPMAGASYVFDNFDDLYTMVNNYKAEHTTDPDKPTPQEAIYNAYLVPKCFIDHNYWDSTNPLYEPIYEGQNAPMGYLLGFPKPTTLNGYLPKNNKMFTYPYCYLIESNNNGTNNVLQFEKFSDEHNCNFDIRGIPSINGSIKCCPTNYNGSTKNEIEGIMAGNFPVLNWSKDNFSDWLIYNSNSSNLKMVTGIGQTVLGMVATAIGHPILGAGLIASGLLGTINALNTIVEHGAVPDTAMGNNLGGDLATAQGTNKFYFYSMCVKYEYAKIIDDFFSMYGYKVNRKAVPDINTRSNWNYIKTVDCNIEGTLIPEKDIEELKNMFNNGITFWHDYSKFRDYSYNNTINPVG